MVFQLIGQEVELNFTDNMEVNIDGGAVRYLLMQYMILLLLLKT